MKHRPFVPNRKFYDTALDNIFIALDNNQEKDIPTQKFNKVDFLTLLGLDSGYQVIIDDNGNIIVTADHLSRDEAIAQAERFRQMPPSIVESREFEVVENSDGYAEKIIAKEDKSREKS